jgi:hypothetical protein
MNEKNEPENSYEKLKIEITVVMMVGLTLFLYGILRNINQPRIWWIIQTILSWIGIVLIIISIVGFIYIKANEKKIISNTENSNNNVDYNG